MIFSSELFVLWRSASDRKVSRAKGLAKRNCNHWLSLYLVKVEGRIDRNVGRSLDNKASDGRNACLFNGVGPKGAEGRSTKYSVLKLRLCIYNVA